MRIFKYLADTLENLIRIIAHSIWVVCVVTPSYFILLLIKWALDQFGQFFEECGISPALRTIFFTAYDPMDSPYASKRFRDFVFWFLDYTESFFSKIWRKCLFLLFLCAIFYILIECTCVYFIKKFGLLTFFFVAAIFFCIGFQHDCRVYAHAQHKASRDKISWCCCYAVLCFLLFVIYQKIYFSVLRALWESSKFVLFLVFSCLLAIGFFLVTYSALLVLTAYLGAYPLVLCAYIFYMFWSDIIIDRTDPSVVFGKAVVYTAFMLIVLKFIVCLTALLGLLV